MIEQASQQLSADNTELACAFIQKMAVEKAILEIDKRLNEVGYQLTNTVSCTDIVCVWCRITRFASRPVVRDGGT